MTANRRRMPRSRQLDQLVGRTIRGGCDDCLAEQTMTRDENGVYHLTIAHDAQCPWYAQRVRGGTR